MSYYAPPRPILADLYHAAPIYDLESAPMPLAHHRYYGGHHHLGRTMDRYIKKQPTVTVACITHINRCCGADR